MKILFILSILFVFDNIAFAQSYSYIGPNGQKIIVKSIVEIPTEYRTSVTEIPASVTPSQSEATAAALPPKVKIKKNLRDRLREASQQEIPRPNIPQAQKPMNVPSPKVVDQAVKDNENHAEATGIAGKKDKPKMGILERIRAKNKKKIRYGSTEPDAANQSDNEKSMQLK